MINLKFAIYILNKDVIIIILKYNKESTIKLIKMSDKTLKDKVVICLYEFLGTAMLLLGYNFTAAGLAVCFSLFVGILLADKISGGMFNPAVTVAVYLSNGKFF